MKRILFTISLFASLLIGFQAVSADHGEDHAPMLIQIQHYQEVNLNPTEDTPSLHPSSLLYGSIATFVDGVQCDATTLPPVENRPGLEGRVVATIQVGTPNQPADCNKEGARVSFVNGRGQVLGANFTFAGGTRETFSNFAPDAFQPGVPGDGVNTGPLAFPGTGSGALVGGGDGRGDTLVVALAITGVILLVASAAAWSSRSTRSL